MKTAKSSHECKQNLNAHSVNNLKLYFASSSRSLNFANQCCTTLHTEVYQRHGVKHGFVVEAQFLDQTNQYLIRNKFKVSNNHRSNKRNTEVLVQICP